MTKTLLSEVILAPEQLRAVGCLVLESSHLEFYVEALLKTFCDNEGMSELLTKNKMIAAKITALQTMLEPTIKNADLKKRFLDFCAKMQSDIGNRNAVVHGDWGLLRSSSIEELQKWRDEGAIVKKASSTFKATEVMKLASRFADYQMDLAQFWIEYRVNLPLKSKFSLAAVRRSRIAPKRRNQKRAKPSHQRRSSQA